MTKVEALTYARGLCEELARGGVDQAEKAGEVLSKVIAAELANRRSTADKLEDLRVAVVALLEAAEDACPHVSCTPQIVYRKGRPITQALVPPLRDAIFKVRDVFGRLKLRKSP